MSSSSIEPFRIVLSRSPSRYSNFKLEILDELLANDAYILREDERKLAPGVSGFIIRTVLSVT